MSTTQGGGERGPKLFTRKPTKAQVKQWQQQQQKASPFPSPPSPSSSSMAASQHSSTAPPPPAPTPKESFARRYKFLWPFVLGVNFVIGAYLFTRTSKKDVGSEGEVPDVPATPTSTTTAASEKPLTSPPVVEPVKLCEPIPEKEQRELFKWLLEEKRKVKPKDPEEKKRIDEEKAILKQFIKAKSIPSL